MIIQISLSAGEETDSLDNEMEFSGKTGDGTRMPRQIDDGELHNETIKEFKHRKKNRNKKPKRALALPRSGTTVQDPGSPRDVFVKKEIWLGRLERDGAPRKRRLVVGGPKGKL